jgi:uncharacterized protein
MAHDLTHEPDAERYVLRIDGQIASIVDYSTNGRTIALTRVFTSPPYRGSGLAAEVMEYTVDDIEANTDLRIVPLCWYAADWFDRHPGRANLVSRASA